MGCMTCAPIFFDKVQTSSTFGTMMRILPTGCCGGRDASATSSRNSKESSYCSSTKLPASRTTSNPSAR
jgi:hypothetical protein